MGSPVDCNCVLVEGESTVLLVDTGSTAKEGASLRRAVEVELKGRALVVVNTHAHYDHCFGNCAFSDRPIWGSDGCVRDLREAGASQRRRASDSWRETAPAFAAELESAAICPPVNLVWDRASLALGALRAELIVLGPAHTDHDLIVHLPELGVVLAGDLVEESGPPALEDSFPLSWATALDRIIDLAPRIVVPGHGREVPLEFVARQRDELAALARWCTARIAHGPEEQDPSLPFGSDQLKVALARARLEAGPDPSR